MIFGISSPFCEQVHLNYKSIFIDCQEIREGIKDFWYSDGFVGKTNKYNVEIHNHKEKTAIRKGWRFLTVIRTDSFKQTSNGLVYIFCCAENYGVIAVQPAMSNMPQAYCI